MTSADSTVTKGHSHKHIWWLMAGFAIVLAGVMGARAYAFGGGGLPGMGMGLHGGKEFMQKRLDKMLDEVKATDAQRTAVNNIAARLQSEMEPIHREHGRLHEQILQAFAADKVDGAAVEKLRAQVTALMERGSQSLTRALVDAANVLNAEQRQTIIKHLQERHGRMRGPR